MVNKTKIDWADMSWNPVSGCLNQCPYCYARKIANRFAPKMPDGKPSAYGTLHTVGDTNIPFPFGFDPTFHHNRLTEPSQIKKPQTIFVCSMADLFGDWVSDEWIRAVFDACAKAPQHRYMFLTKNAMRTAQYDRWFKDHNNCWCGISITNQEQEYGLAQMLIGMGANRFISIEPILEPVMPRNRLRFPFADWVIIGAETGNRKGKVVPEKKWILDILDKCVRCNVPIFMKESLRNLMGDDFKQEYPWEANHEK